MRGSDLPSPDPHGANAARDAYDRKRWALLMKITDAEAHIDFYESGPTKRREFQELLAEAKRELADLDAEWLSSPNNFENRDN